jgi:riboflavin kinase/FMN adenylyltransferase
LRDAGADAAGVIDFTREFASMQPEVFLHNLLHNNGGCHVCGIAVGSNWRFGCQGKGTPAMLTAAGIREGFQFRSVTLLTAAGERISSSLIRQKEAAGDLPQVRNLLGRNHELYGKVVRDLHIGSTLLGFPTANISLEAGVPPPDGVYAGLLDGMPAAVNIGVSPSVEANGLRHRIEAHIIAEKVELSGMDVRLELIQKIRDEQKFPSFDALKERIAMDITAIKSILSQYFKGKI